MIDPDNCWYRYTDFRYAAPLDEYEQSIGDGRAAIRLCKFQVLKHTPKGVWIDNYGTRRFVRLKATKRFACPTKEDAYESFLARKKRQLRILTLQVKHIQEVIRLVDASSTQDFD